ncbi:DUF262 domain-containing protein [Streptomyces sp. WAC05374]|nr:DUF262 domain-containing protein [Streptomyces sp. WAC05374]TDF47120.1 DUF262 domain-containing protein [Streptomyces sp. WAC05374]TDF57378.1 DUF262 domain-containing protein [Streptomyces sp. WAC05374]TDF61483.1 DUF262 domain-containing protein [Streptomyces sp. WAC05374]
MADLMSETKAVETLEMQIADRRREISTERYSMSIGELCNLYTEGELTVHPEFQRFFRWDDSQKSRLIESILLGIPLPPIFVAQTDQGGWDLVDGLQRVSTLLQLQGLLRDEKGRLRKPLVLQGTKYLPALEGRVWESQDDAFTLTKAQKLDVRRARIDVQIIQRQSSSDAKYDLFQRLNSYGSQLTPQELRSCLLVAVNPAFLAWIESLASSALFSDCVGLSERLIREQYDVELVLRFLVLHNRAKLRMADLRNFTQVLDDESVDLARAFPGNKEELEDVFTRTFRAILAGGGENVFRKFDTKKKVFAGSFLNTSFEVFGMGIGYCMANDIPFKVDLLRVVEEFWSRPEMAGGFATGLSTETRMARYIPLGREVVTS